MRQKCVKPWLFKANYTPDVSLTLSCCVCVKCYLMQNDKSVCSYVQECACVLVKANV